MSAFVELDYTRQQQKKIIWDQSRTTAASMLAVGIPKTQVADEVGITRRTLYHWLDDPEFLAEVDKLSLMAGIASRAERLRLINRLVRQRVAEDGTIESDKDVLDWLKFAQSETDGAKLDLSKLTELLTGQPQDDVSDNSSNGNLLLDQSQPAIDVTATPLAPEHGPDEELNAS